MFRDSSVYNTRFPHSDAIEMLLQRLPDKFGMIPLLQKVGNVYDPSMTSSKRFPSAGESNKKP